MDSRVITLTLAAHKHGNLNIRTCGREFFPKNVFGSSSKEKGLGIPITLKVSGLKNPVKTDIPTDRATGKPRWIFRERAWVKKFVKSNCLIPGDKIKIVHVSNRAYKLVPQKRKLTFIDLFAGIGGMRLAFEKAGCKCVFSDRVTLCNAEG